MAYINGKEVLFSATVDAETVDAKLQEKTVTENGTVTPDSGFDGLSKVTVNVPTEEAALQIKTVEITANGDSFVLPDSGFDGLSEVAISVNVPSESTPVQEKSITITENGTREVTADSGFALSKVTIKTNVSSGGGGSSDVKTLKGTITFHDNIYNSPLSMGETIEQDIAFASGGSDFKQFKIVATSLDDLPEVTYYYNANGMYATASSAGSGTWDMDAFKTITIVGEAVVSEAFYNWVMANASVSEAITFSVNGYSESYTVASGTTWGEFVTTNSTPFGIGQDDMITFMGSSFVYSFDERNGETKSVCADDVITSELIYSTSDN